MILAIYGAGGQGSIVLDVAVKQNENVSSWDEILFIDDYNEEGMSYGHKRIHLDTLLNSYIIDNIQFNVALGEVYDKKRIYQSLIDLGLVPTNIIAPDAQIGSAVKLGNGLFINTGAIIHPSSEIGNNVTIMERTTVGHHCCIGSDSFLAAGINIGGNNNIGSNTFIGLHAVTREKLNIGHDVVIGMGSVVVKNVEDYTVVVGNPAKKLKNNNGEKIFKPIVGFVK